MTSRIGKIVSVTVIHQKYPQMWSQEKITGLVVQEKNGYIMILNNDGKTISINTEQVMEIFEKS